MNKFVTIGLGAAAVVVVLLLGTNLLRSSSPPPGGAPSESAAPSEAEPSVEPSAAADLPVGSSFDLTAAGADTDDAFITVTIPAPGWFGEPGEGSMTKDLGADGSQSVVVLPHEWYRVPSDICRWQSSDETPRPSTSASTVDEMVAALAAQTYETADGSLTRDPTTPRDITIDGEPGQFITLVSPRRDPHDCDDQRFCSLMNRDGVCWLSTQEPGYVGERFWIVQSSQTPGGPNPWLVAASYSAMSSELSADLNNIVHSITTDYSHP